MKHLVTKPHIMLSVNNPRYKGTSQISHEEAVRLLSSYGKPGSVHTIKGSYGAPEESIFISEPTDAQTEQARKLAHQTGQESHIESDGQNHKMLFSNGPQAGQIVTGSGTKFHDQIPDDFFSQLPDGTTFTHNFDLVEGVKKSQEPLMKPYTSEARRRWAHTKAGTKALGRKEAVRHWDKVATHANPYTNNAMIRRKLSAEDSDYYLAASELRKNKVSETFLAGILGISSAQVAADLPKIQVQQQQKRPYDDFHYRMKDTIAQVESGGGRHLAHIPLPEEGIHSGTRAFGKYGITPVVTVETAKLNPDISNKYPELLRLPLNEINSYLRKNPGLEDEIADRHIKRLRSHFGDDPAKIGYAWLNGVTGTKRAIKENRPIHDHWHVKKIKRAFDSLGKKHMSKSNYGPKQMGLYSQAENIRRKASRTGEEVPIGPNAAVRFAGPTRNKQAEMQAKIDREKSRRNPVKIYSPEERKMLAEKKGLLAASEKMNKAPMPKPNLTQAPLPSAPKINLNPEHGKMLAQVHEQATHSPKDPKTQKAYAALINETAQQYKDLVSKGYKFSPIKRGQPNPYKTSKELHQDLENNKHLWYFPTKEGFGPEGSDTPDHPLYADSGLKDSHGNNMMHNDVFRAVHDVMGHHFGGKTTFGPKGEMQAYLTHKKMYSPEAHPALAAETLLQNSAVNYGKHGEHNRSNPEKTIYAEQKAFAAPDWVVNGRWHE